MAAILNFQPQLSALPGYKDDQPGLRKLLQNLQLGILSSRLKVYDYIQAIERMQGRNFPYPWHPCIMVGWDNTPRRGKKGKIIKNQTPEAFGSSLKWGKEKLKSFNGHLDDQIIFINAWNEWAEGNYLEPCIQNGYSYLEKVKEVFG